MGKNWLLLLSLLAILASPFLLWNAASQNRANDFESAKEVDITSDENSYILIEGTATATERLNCPTGDEDTQIDENCIYVATSVEEYQRVENEVCESRRPDNVIEQRDSKCDSNGNCTPCYLIEEFEWESVSSEVDSVEFTIGSYAVSSIESANRLGFETFEVIEKNTSTNQNSTNNRQENVDDIADAYFGEETQPGNDPYYDLFEESEPTRETTQSENRASALPEEGDQRFNYTYLENESDVVIAGEARNNEIYNGDQEFVVSALSYGETLSRLTSQDESSSTALRVFSFIFMVGGFVVFFTTLASIPLLLTKIIPFVGEGIKDVTNSIVGFVAFIVGGILWGSTFALISFIRSPIALILVVGIVAFFGYQLWNQRQEISKT